MTSVIKLLRAHEWAAFRQSGVFAGSPDDLRDGYIHISPPSEVAATAAKWFAGETGLMALTLDADSLGDSLKWEPARGGILFPHLYRVLTLDDVISASPLPLAGKGDPAPSPGG